jgi:hypothetical protein
MPYYDIFYNLKILGLLSIHAKIYYEFKEKVFLLMNKCKYTQANQDTSFLTSP